MQTIDDKDLKELAIKTGKEFLISEDVPDEEQEPAFGGYCCGFYTGYMMACKDILDKLEKGIQ